MQYNLLGDLRLGIWKLSCKLIDILLHPNEAIALFYYYFWVSYMQQQMMLCSESDNDDYKNENDIKTENHKYETTRGEKNVECTQQFSSGNTDAFKKTTLDEGKHTIRDKIAEAEEFCNVCLQKTSRSFAAVIAQLPEELRKPIAVFYLILRALDCIEDDTTIEISKKQAVMHSFTRKFRNVVHSVCCDNEKLHTYKIYDESVNKMEIKKSDVSELKTNYSNGGLPDMSSIGFGKGLRGFYNQKNDYEALLVKDIEKVVMVMNGLKKKYRDCILYITDRIAAGMVKFLIQPVETIDDYNEYCYYVAGLVGIGLTRLFNLSHFEDLRNESALQSINLKELKFILCERGTEYDTSQGDDINLCMTDEIMFSTGFDSGHGRCIIGDSVDYIERLAISMGLFLQKTNIIRDYFEDVNQHSARVFYPAEIWKKYVAHFEELGNRDHEINATQCLNEMIANALSHVPYCIIYLSLLRNQFVFSFCAIPQVMAIATLERCFNNPNVFSSLVKIRKGETAIIFIRCRTCAQTFRYFHYYLRSILDKNRFIAHELPVHRQIHFHVHRAIRVIDYLQRTLF